MAEARYDAVADFYIAGFDEVSDPASRALLELAGPLAGRDVLDLACGHGRITRELARRGGRVTGLDISGVLLDRAREAERARALGIRYIQWDVTAADAVDAGGVPAGAIPPAAFDLAVCNFGLSDIDDLDAALTAVSAALRPGARFVFSIVHPCFAGSADISGSWAAGGRYYDEGRWIPPGRRSSLRRRVGASHRMLSTYLGTCLRHGLRLDQIAEPPPPGDWDPAHEADRQPVYLVASFRKDDSP